MPARPIRILRPSRTSALVSSAFFDGAFARNLRPEIEVTAAPLVEWWDELLGPGLDGAAARLAGLARGYDFICPSYECVPLTPLLAFLRNRAGAPVRLLFLAHAPGAFLLEWAMLAPLLSEGDVIVAPSHGARDTIAYLCPRLLRNVHVIPHPIHAIGEPATVRDAHLVSLQRMHPDKLVHRQVDAVRLLHDRGLRVTLDIGGPLSEQSGGALHGYARCLVERVKRLGLEKHVRFAGLVSGDEQKRGFLAGAAASLCLSVCTEEAFPKSSVESLGAGVPVIATRWDGLVETVGGCGALVELDNVGPGLAVDLDAAALADAIAGVLASPPSAAACRAHAAQFAPDSVRPRYRDTLAAALDSPLSQPEPSGQLAPFLQGGLLGATAPLTICSWDEMLCLLTEEQSALRQGWLGGGATPPVAASRLRQILADATRRDLELFLAGLRPAQTTTACPDASCGPCGVQSAGERTMERMLLDALDSPASDASRRVCLAALRDMECTDAFLNRLARLRAEAPASRGMKYLQVEALRLAGHHDEAWRACADDPDPALWGEHGAFWLRLLARIAREWERPHLALPALQDWLRQFPDSPLSGPVWLDLAVNAANSGPEYCTEAESALESAARLLGELPIVSRLRDAIKPGTAEKATHLV